MPYSALLPLLCLLLLQGCSAGSPRGAGTWQSPLELDHPLTGVIWRSRDSRFLSQAELLQELATFQYLLLGEKHDNPDHHRLQRLVLQSLRDAGRLESLTLEMLASDQQPLIDSVASVNLASEAAVRSHLAWDEEGWDWDHYGPLLLDALRDAVPVKAGNISQDEMMAVYQSDVQPRTAGVLDGARMERLNREIDESHCGMLPSSQFPAMVRVQQSRDARMADRLLEPANGGQGIRVLVAGNFHVRRDLGVANYLPEGAGALAALAFMEVSADLVDPVDYLQAFSATMPYDYVWFTPAVTAEDYCAALRAGNTQ